MSNRKRTAAAAGLAVYGASDAPISVMVNTAPLFASSSRISIHAMAATRIQRVLRSTMRHAFSKVLAAAFLSPDTGVLIQRIKAMSFDDMIAHLRLPAVMDNARKFFQRVARLASDRHRTLAMPEICSGEERSSVRVLLAAFMIAFRHEYVFEPPSNETQRSLIDISLRMVERLESVALLILEGGGAVPVKLTCDLLLPLVEEFINQFWAWKVPDQARLERSIQDELIRLDDSLARAYFICHLDQASAEAAITDIKNRIRQERERLIRIGGQSALRKFDEGRKGAKSDAFETMCFMASPDSIDDYHYLSPEGMAHELLLDPLFQIKAPRKKCSIVGEEAGSDDNDTDGKSNNNNNYDPFSQSDEQTQAFWGGLIRDLSFSPPCYFYVIQVLEYLRGQLCELFTEWFPRSISTMTANGIIDMQLIQQQIQHDACDWDSWSNLVQSIVSSLERIRDPAYVEETHRMYAALRARIEAESRRGRSSWQYALCRALEFLVDRTCVAQRNLINRKLRLCSGTINRFGAGYEQMKFANKIASGKLTLNGTQRLVSEIVQVERHGSTIVFQGLVQGKQDSYLLLFGKMVVSLFSTHVFSEERIPETLYFDKHRLRWACVEFNRVVDRVAVLVYACSYVSPSSAPLPPSPEKRAALSALSSALVRDLRHELNMEEVVSFFDGIVMQDDGIAAVLGRGVIKDDPVRKLIADRLRDLLVICIATSESKLKANYKQTFMNLEGSSELLVRMEVFAASVVKFTSFNLKVHSRIYNELIAASVKSSSASGSV